MSTPRSKRGQPQRAVITRAEKSLPDQLRARQKRYALMMGIRVVAVVAGAIIAYNRPPLWGLWVGICIAGMVFLPWMAVLIANDRPPRNSARLSSHLPGHQGTERGLGGGEQEPGTSLQRRHP